MTTWDEEQVEAMKHIDERLAEIRKAGRDIAHIRAVEMDEPEWKSALGAFLLFAPIFGVMFYNMIF